jgi:hypothetical protein
MQNIVGAQTALTDSVLGNLMLSELIALAV